MNWDCTNGRQLILAENGGQARSAPGPGSSGSIVNMEGTQDGNAVHELPWMWQQLSRVHEKICRLGVTHTATDAKQRKEI